MHFSQFAFLRTKGDNALLLACPLPRRRVRAIATVLAYGVGIGVFWLVCVALRAGGVS